MGTQEKDYWHGAALTQIVENKTFKTLNSIDHKFGHYEINRNRILVKVSKKEQNPWQFNIKINELQTINEDIELKSDFYLCLVCGKETICILDEEQIKKLVNLELNRQQTLFVGLETGCSMRVWRKKKEFEIVVHHNDFPKKYLKTVR